MELRVLNYFLTVAREESFSRAAEKLHLSQPTLSRQLKDLEEEFGKQLLIREPRRILLTDDGELLRRRAEESDAADDELPESRFPECGCIVILEQTDRDRQEESPAGHTQYFSLKKGTSH